MAYTIITGATGALGRAFATALAARGEPLLLMGRSQSALDELCRALPGSPVHAHRADFRDWDPALALANATAALGGSPRGLIHCAGVSMRAAIQDLRSPTAIAQVMQVNITAAIQLTATCAPFLAEQKGHVVFVSSLAEFAGMRDIAIYGACKRALSAFADSFDAEYGGRGVHVLKAYPGEMRTMLQQNELNGDGVAYGDDARYEGPFVEPDVVAAATLRALARRKRRVFVPRSGRVFPALCWIAPGLVRVAMRSI